MSGARPSRETLGRDHSKHCDLWPKTSGISVIRIFLLLKWVRINALAQRVSSSNKSKHGHQSPGPSARGQSRNWTQKGSALLINRQGKWPVLARWWPSLKGIKKQLIFVLMGQCQMLESESPRFADSQLLEPESGPHVHWLKGTSSRHHF